MNTLIIKGTIHTYLHLYALTIDEFDTGHQGIEYNGRFTTGIHNDGIHFAFDSKRAVLAPKHINHIIHLYVIDY